jgi:hypothetical protein
MAIGLTRTKNLSELNLNLKNALQKLYAPGIESDIELFSLSSSLESFVLSGEFNTPTSQIFRVSTERLGDISGNIIKRTKFSTKFFTFTDGNEVYFTNYTLGAGSDPDITPVKFSNNGSIPDLEVITGGGGYYLTNISGGVFDPGADPLVVLENVPLRGQLSGATSARAKVTLVAQNLGSGIDTEELERFTPGSTVRYTISSVEIENGGQGYLIPELLELVEGTVRFAETGVNISLVRQKGILFSGQPEIIRTKQFVYIVKGASSSGFFLYDEKNQKYLYVDRSTPESGFAQQDANSITLKRFDGVNIKNILQFKFAQSRIFLRGYNYSFGIGGGSISGEINSVASRTNSLQIRSQAAIQNTRRPTPPESEENIFGYRYNSFVGQDVVIWQRLVLRDQDFILQPSGSVTGDQLRSNVSNFQLNSTGEKVPGLFVKVGAQYFRAFSTTDKPFFREGLNPVLSAGINQYSLSAEDSNDSGVTWYAYNTQISELAQRIHPNGRDGAFYYHRTTAPSVRSFNTSVGTRYAVPLFTFVT